MDDRKRQNNVAEWWDTREEDFEAVNQAIQFKLTSQPKAYVVKNFPGGHFETRQRVIRRFVEMEKKHGAPFKSSEWPQKMLEALESLPPVSSKDNSIER